MAFLPSIPHQRPAVRKRERINLPRHIELAASSLFRLNAVQHLRFPLTLTYTQKRLECKDTTLKMAL